MCCGYGKAKGCVSVSRLLLTFFSLLFILCSFVIIFLIFFSDRYWKFYKIIEAITSSIIFLFIGIFGTSVSCCPNKSSLIIYSILLVLVFVLQLCLLIFNFIVDFDMVYFILCLFIICIDGLLIALTILVISYFDKKKQIIYEFQMEYEKSTTDDFQKNYIKSVKSIDDRGNPTVLRIASY